MSNAKYVEQLIISSKYKGGMKVEGTGVNLTVKVDDRAAAKSALYKMLDQKKYPYKDEKTLKSSFNVTRIKSPDKKDLMLIWKNLKGGGGSGAGAAITELGESAQCWYTACAFNGTLKSQDDFVKMYPKIAARCKTDATIQAILKDLPDDWIESSIKIANYMRGMGAFKTKMKSYYFHRGGAVVDKIATMFNKANRKETLFSNINKWNPADIWLITSEGERAIKLAKDDQTFASLNDLISKLYKSGDAIGVSLKKVGASPHHEVFNYGKSGAAASFKQFKISEKSKDGYILFSYKDDPNMSIQTRSFTDTGSWQGEIKGKYASGGKIGGGQIAEIFGRVSKAHLSASNAKAITLAATTRSPVLIKQLKAFAKDLNVKINDPTHESTDWVYSKYLTLEMYSIYKTLTKKQQDQILNEIVGYAASSTENSSVFIKIS